MVRKSRAGQCRVGLVRWVREETAAPEMKGKNIVNILACGRNGMSALHSVMASWPGGVHDGTGSAARRQFGIMAAAFGT